MLRGKPIPRHAGLRRLGEGILLVESLTMDLPSLVTPVWFCYTLSIIKRYESLNYTKILPFCFW